LAIWGEVTPGAIFTKCGLWGDMVDVITCAIFGDSRLRGVGVMRGVSLPSPIDFTRRPYNTVWPCDLLLHYLQNATAYTFAQELLNKSAMHHACGNFIAVTKQEIQVISLLLTSSMLLHNVIITSYCCQQYAGFLVTTLCSSRTVHRYTAPRTYNITVSRNAKLSCVVRGVNLPSPIDLTRCPYNTGHTIVWPCDRRAGRIGNRTQAFEWH